RVGLRVALAPDFLGGENLRHVAALLFLGAPVDERWAEQRNAEAGEGDGGASALELLLVDDALEHGCAAASVLLGPAEPDPSALVQLAMPSDQRLPFAFGLVGQRLARGSGILPILFEPGAEFGSKRLVLGAVVEVHLYLPASLRCGSLQKCISHPVSKAPPGMASTRGRAKPRSLTIDNP